MVTLGLAAEGVGLRGRGALLTYGSPFKTLFTLRLDQVKPNPGCAVRPHFALPAPGPSCSTWVRGREGVRVCGSDPRSLRSQRGAQLAWALPHRQSFLR